MEFKAENEDLYALLEIPFEASTNEIKKAYRKKALICHPDKNPNNKNAAEEFHKLSKILEILTDAVARKAYDRVLKAKKEAAIRHSQLDSKRRKLKEVLEAREQLNANRKSADDLFQDEINRLRREGSKQVQEEMEYMRKLITEQLDQVETFDASQYRIKLSWKAEKSDNSNGGYTHENLHRFLSKYGNINVLILSSKKKGSGMVEFSEKRAAEMAFDIEKGLATNPLTLTWVDERKTSSRKSAVIKDTDFESLTLMKLRQAEERKRLIEQLMQEEDA